MYRKEALHQRCSTSIQYQLRQSPVGTVICTAARLILPNSIPDQQAQMCVITWDTANPCSDSTTRSCSFTACGRQKVSSQLRPEERYPQPHNSPVTTVSASSWEAVATIPSAPATIVGKSACSTRTSMRSVGGWCSTRCFCSTHPNTQLCPLWIITLCAVQNTVALTSLTPISDKRSRSVVISFSEAMEAIFGLCNSRRVRGRYSRISE